MSCSLRLPACKPAHHVTALHDLRRPGVGKTTAIREVSRALGDDLMKRVVIVDTSNEIGGVSA